MLIGITGKARSGKDTFSKMLAQSLRERTGGTYVLMAYANELKNRVQKDFDLSYDQLWGDAKEEEDKRYKKSVPGMFDSFWTAREIMQAYGEFYRSIDYDFWVRILFNKIEENEYANVIITDVRHPNEADPIKERKGYVIKVVREEIDKIHGSKHISEIAMDKYKKIDLLIENNYDLKELKKAADLAADYLIERYKKEANNG
jgi:CO dehydrogenase nickel-insertion accessory protein CooC1